MGKKNTQQFYCTECGNNYPRWQGQCHFCGSWNTIKEFRGAAPDASSALSSSAASTAHQSEAIRLREITKSEKTERIASSFTQVDAIFGGGLVAGSVVLLGGDPGIGKSTLALQLCAQWQQKSLTTCYISGEESLQQIYLRAERLGLADSDATILAQTDLEAVCIRLDELTPDIVVIDSIQTMMSAEIDSPPGSVSQLRHTAAQLISRAKRHECAVVLIGHVTKEGTIAGPRLIEHMVDTVISFESDKSDMYRIMRTIKNRFGPAGELAVLSMQAHGLHEVENPSHLFCSTKEAGHAGTIATAVIEGSRALVVEIQSLVSPTHFGMPQRVCAGINQKKLALLLAVMEKHAGINLGEHDVFINVAGGLRVDDTASDIAVCAAVLSSFFDKTPAQPTACIGEVGLSGEIRSPHRSDMRVKEIDTMGIARCCLPSPRLSYTPVRTTLVGCAHIAELAQVLF